ncbi:MFS transporter [Tsukamurella sp. 8F]|uniref:MFS transporter n=1 Tax=unclassified Tsukamurella TaxID=2633480 RepID=UPI0023BA3C70|nr:MULTISPECIES: MFS transporter [unclassified Tsukamurella]MDF0529815.1 MFS transporter [Tsukamurella sp. 8J]MDF0587007.1 MFS transporter [Tsukamurella sp. 8F]
MKLLADTRPLQNPDYRRLWWTGIVTVIGAQLTAVAVPAQIYGITGSSAYVGLTGVFGLVPLVVFGLWGGALADAVDRRTLIFISTCGLAVTSLLLFLSPSNVWAVLCIFALQQAFFGINSPTRSAIYARLVPGELLPAANSLNMTVMQFGAIAGPLIGGALIPVIGLKLLYLVDALSMMFTLWAVWRLPSIKPEYRGQTLGLRSVLDGFAYLAGNKVLLMSFVVDIIAMVFGMPRALFPQIAHQSFGGPVEGGTAFALLFAAMSAGAVIGGVFSGWTSRIERQGLAVVIAIVVWGVTLVGFGLAAAAGLLWLALLFLAAGGAADMVSAAFRSTMLQEAATDDVRGRLQGVFTVVVAGGPRIGDVAHGLGAATVGATAAAAGGGVAVVVFVLIAAAAVPAFVRYRVAR